MNFFQKIKLVSCIIVIWVISSCVAPGTMPVPIIASSPTVTIVSPTVLSPTIGPIPALEKPTIELSLEAGCIPIEDKIPADLFFSGSWIRNERTPYLEYLNEGSTYTVPLEGKGLFSTDKGDFAISADGKYLAYIDKYIDPVRHDTEKRILRIIKSSGHVLPMDYWAVDWQWIIGWIDNQHLALLTGNEIIALNPFTGEWKEFERPKWLSPDSDYNLLLYRYIPALNWLLLETDHRTFEVRDVQSDELIWNMDGYAEPMQSGDGSTLALMTTESITLITKERQISKFHIPDLELIISTT
jgi:hypothetical protein